MTGPVTLLAGGKGGDPDAMLRVLQALIARLGGAPSVAYLGAANGDSPRFLAWMEPVLRQAGAGEVTHVKTVGSPVSKTARRKLEQAGLVFVGGGDVEEGMRVIEARGLGAVLREQHCAGTAFCGVSAGSIMLAKEWVRWKDPEDDSSAERFECLGIADVRVDTHGEEDKWQELVDLMKLCPSGSVGYGLRSGSAIEVNAKGTITVCAGTVDAYTHESAGVTQAAALHAPGKVKR
jgi:peptidase E